MKKGVFITLVLVLALLALISAVEPALCKPEQKISATATLRFPTVTQPERTINTNGEIRHVFGVQETFGVVLTLDEQFDGQTTFTGDVVVVLDFTANFKTGETVYHSTSLVWSFQGGSFEGMMQARQRIDLNSQSGIYEESVVLQGSGIFKGCTLKLSQTNNQPYTGLLFVSASVD
jgi:hypothetical protein